MKQIFTDYNISTLFTPVNTLKNSPVHPNDIQQKSRESNVVYEICCNQNLACQDAYIGETSQPLQKCLRQHCRSSYNWNDSALFKHIISSGHQIDVNDVTILYREENWFEHGANEAVWVGTTNPSLDCNGGTRITLSLSWDCSINTLHSFSPFQISSRSKKSAGRNTNTSCHNNHYLE